MRGLRQAREGEERGRGVPYTDVDRATRHYGIDPETYYQCPECYPLPGRGAGLTRRVTQGDNQNMGVGILILGIVAGAIAIARK